MKASLLFKFLSGEINIEQFKIKVDEEIFKSFHNCMCSLITKPREHFMNLELNGRWAPYKIDWVNKKPTNFTVSGVYLLNSPFDIYLESF